jgi:hypothetical protein
MPDSTYNQFKSWIFPALVSALGMMIWSDVTEIKKDVKALMLQSSIDKTRIDNLEREVYKERITYKSPFPPADFPKQVLREEMVAVLRDNDLTPKDYETYN